MADEVRGIVSYLLYVLKLLIIARATCRKTPNMVKKQAKSDQTAKSVTGYKWSRKVTHFCKVKEKGLTYRVTFLKF